MKKGCAAVFLLVVLQYIYAYPAAAHVLITDQSASKGAILHVTPDDDPVAGKKATLYLDTQGVVFDGESRAAATVTQKASGETSTVEAAISGALITLDYVFPTRGVYEIEYGIESKEGLIQFTTSMRISRGDVATTQPRSNHTWAEALLAFSGIGCIVLCIVVFNRRDALVRQSRF